jgi:hypothetical protein
MLSASNLEISEILHTFSVAGLDCSFLVPTQTGLEKSIMDATSSLREFLKTEHIHDFDSQSQGPENKKIIETIIFSKDSYTETTTSLYRPNTKNGDPRIWFSRLKEHAEPTDLLAVLVSQDRLIVINCSKTDLKKLILTDHSIFWNYYHRKSIQLPSEAQELLQLLSDISKRGFVNTMRAGDTGVGFTLETLLGISANSSKAPDFKGIEIKSGRGKSVDSGRTTVFSQVPLWSISRLKGSAEILRERGRFNEKKNRNQLFHEIDARKPNSYGLILVSDDKEGLLHQEFHNQESNIRDVSWKYETLFQRLEEKHKKTFWVKAETKGKGSSEQFWYNDVKYTAGVNPQKLPLLVDAGIISIDYTIKQTPSGGAKDQGYLFKIRRSDLPLLFRSQIQLAL